LLYFQKRVNRKSREAFLTKVFEDNIIERIYYELYSVIEIHFKRIMILDLKKY